MDDDPDRERATQPEELSRLIVERLNTGDVDGLVVLYNRTRYWLCPTARSPPVPRRSARLTSGWWPTGRI
jgi:hypothetical protein